MFLLSLIFLVFCVLTTVTAGHPSSVKSYKVIQLHERASDYRLPTHTYPETYDLSIQTRVDLNKFDFRGLVKIGIVVNQTTREIVLHARQLTISQVNLFRVRGNAVDTVNIQSHVYDEIREFIRIQTNGVDLNAGDRLQLSIAYNGSLREDTFGFYKSSYSNSDGTRRWLAVTHFEPTDARHAFPCYDEPALKAKFTIRITHGKQYNAISNMPETRGENSDDTATTSFRETQLMSTYLVAFVVSDFQYTTNTNDSTAFQFRVFSRPGKLKSTRLALETGQKVLKAFENYLQVNYTFPKMDQVALPDFPIGGMENWGIITYKENSLLWNETIHPSSRQLNIVRLISHEFSHQNFGNRVSNQWWSYVWLKEGFATLFEVIGTDLLYPEWNMFQYFVTTTLHRSLQLDYKYPKNRPMTDFAESPTEIANLFDNIAYQKSGSVLRMFMHAFTEKSFKKGLRYYLNKHAFGSATDNDLFDELERAVIEDKTLPSHLSVNKILKSWTNQRGYPMLHVQRHQADMVTIKQSTYPFVYGISSWWIPYNFATSNNISFDDTTPDGWYPGEQNRPYPIFLNLTDDDWIIFNKQQTGYYRVLYDDKNYKLITRQLLGPNFAVIHVLNRAQLIDDSFEYLMQNDYTNTALIENFLALISYLRNDTEYAPWVPAVKAFKKLDSVLEDTKCYDAYRAHVSNLTSNFYERLGLDDIAGEEILRKDARVQAIDIACQFGLPKCLAGTYLKLKATLQQNVTHPPNTNAVLIRNGVRSASEKELKILWDRLIKSNDQSERYVIASSLGFISNRKVLKEYLKQSLDDESLTASEKWAVFSSAKRNGQFGLQICMELFVNNMTDVINKYGVYDLNAVFDSFTEFIYSRNRGEEFTKLLNVWETRRYLTESQILVLQSKVTANVFWFYFKQDIFNNWFSQQKGNAMNLRSLPKYYLVILTVVSCLYARMF